MDKNTVFCCYLIHTNPATTSPEREKLSYICGFRARIECERGEEANIQPEVIETQI